MTLINKIHGKVFMLFMIIIVLQPLQSYSETAFKKKVSSQGIAIIGDQEMPQVLYIIPWKAASLPTVSIHDADIIKVISYNPCQLMLSDATSKKNNQTSLACLLNLTAKNN